MSIFAKQIEAAVKRRNEFTDAMTKLVNDAEEQERALTEDEQKQFDNLRAEIETIDLRIKTLQESEDLVAKSARPVEPQDEHDTAQPPERGTGPLITRKQKPRVKGGFFARQAHVLYLAQGNMRVAAEIAERELGDKEMALVMRAAQSGADSSTSSWAGTLLDQEMRDFIDLLRPLSVYSRMPAATTFTFDTTNSIKVPRLSTGTPGGFVAEGGAIPVKQGSFDSITLTPSKLGVITVATREILARSTPALEQLLRDMMLRDTAITLDRRFFSALAPSASAPAGLLHSTNAAAPITASDLSNAADDAIADLKNLMAAMFTANVPMSSMVWLMHPSKKLDLMNLRAATGAFYFRDELVGGTLYGYPVLDSSVLDKGVNDGGTSNIGTVALVDAGMLYKANGIAPTISLSADATLHMDDAPNPDVFVPASGGRSLFQTDAVALRLIWETTWRTGQAASVQYVNNVNW